MRWSFIAIACFVLTSAGLLNAQQTLQNPPAGPNQHAIQNQAAGRTPAAVQQYQNALRARATRAQGAAPNVNVNNRDPARQIVPGDGQNGANQPIDQAIPPDSGFFDPYGSSYAAGGGGGVVTAEQGRLVGIADGLRGLGEFNRNTAAANVLQQQANGLAIDNRYDAVQTYFQVRQLNRQQRALERGPTPTQEDLLRYSQSRVPERLTVAALDRDTGAIHWPAVLTGPEFADHRARLEQIFQGRSYYNSGVASESYLEIQDETARMLATLQDLVRAMDPAAYVQAKKFIVGLGFEGRFLAGHDRVAMKQ
jgi:hypothetical protein